MFDQGFRGSVSAKEAAPDRALALDPMEYGKGHHVGLQGDWGFEFV